MTTSVNEAVEVLCRHKASRIKNSAKYRSYLGSLLEELDIRDPVEAGVLGAVDAMVYDVACALDFTKQKGQSNDWSSWENRKELLRKLVASSYPRAIG